MHHRRTSATVLCRSNCGPDCGPPAGRAADGHLAGPHTMGIPWHRGTERALNQERAFRDEVQATRWAPVMDMPWWVPTLRDTGSTALPGESLHHAAPPTATRICGNRSNGRTWSNGFARRSARQRRA